MMCSCRTRCFIPAFLCILALFAWSPGQAYAASPSNSGLTGLWEYPTAQIVGDGKGWIGLTDTDPYQYGYVNLGFLPWLEANLRLTRFETGQMISPGYGRYKDKSMDFKVLLRQQKGLSPSVAVGVTDMLGTELMKAYYSVATYQWDRFALTMGYGTDRMNGFFGGIAWQASPCLELKAEYSPLDYTGDRAGSEKVHPYGADSKINFGAVATLPGGTRLSLSHQRGEQTCLSLAYPFDLSRSFRGKPKNPLAKTPDAIPVPDWSATDLTTLADEIEKTAARELGFRNVEIFAGKKKLLIAYENIAFSSPARAMAGLMALVAYRTPWDMESLSLVARVRDRVVTRVDIPGEQLALFRLKDIIESDKSGAVFRDRGFVTDFGAFDGEVWTCLREPDKTRRKGQDHFALTPAWEPRIDRSLDEDYMDRWSLDANWRHRFGKGWESYLDVRIPIENDIDPDILWWEPETNDETRIWKGVLSYWQRFTDNIWLLGEAGWLDANWFGGNLWGRWYMEDSRWWLGFRASLVHERDPEDFAGLSEHPITYQPTRGIYNPGDYDTEWWFAGWVQAGYHEPELNLDLSAEGGQFIDGDTGVRLAVDRHWDDVTLGAWISRTDRLTDDRDYSNAGLYLEIPAEFWTGNPSDVTWTQEFSLLSSWRLYSARQPGSWMPPEKLWEPLRPARLRNDLYNALAELTALARGEETEKNDRTIGLIQYLKGER